MSERKAGSIIRRGVAYARRDARETLGSNPLLSLAGVAVIIIALIIMVVVSAFADRASEDRRDQLANELEPFANSLNDLEVRLLTLAGDARAYVSAGDAESRERYESSSASLAEKLPLVAESSRGSGFEAEFRDVAAPAFAYLTSARRAAAIVERGDAPAAQRALEEDGRPILDDSALAFEELDSSVAAEIDRLRARIRDVERLERSVWLVAGPLAVIAAGTLSWLALVNQRLLRLAREEEGRFSSIHDSLTRHGICQTDTAGRIRYCNPAAAEMIGYGVDELIGKSLHDLTHSSLSDADRPHADCPLDAASRRNAGDDWFARKDGSVLPVSVTSQPVLIEGRPAGAIIVFEDITERLKQARMREQFISFASHELRTPLMIVGGFAQRLQMRARAKPELFDERSRDEINELAEGAARMRTITEIVLDLTRVESGQALISKKEVVDLKDALEREAKALMKTYPNVKLDLVPADEPLVVESDKARLGQVLANLLDNAAKYGGEPPIVTVSASREAGVAVVRVRDNGAGIPAEEQAQIFERFHRGASAAGKTGLGVGLFIARRIVDRMGGSLTFSSEAGKGTEFKLTLPLMGKATSAARAKD